MVVGKVISHYRVLEKIGEGGLGVVYATEDTILSRRVALKFLTRTERSEARQQILEEAFSRAKPFGIKAAIFTTDGIPSKSMWPNHESKIFHRNCSCRDERSFVSGAFSI